MRLEGIFAPIATPFDHKGDLYPAKLQHNIERWNLTSLAGYVVCSATGEDVLLASEEKVAVWEMAAKYAEPGKTLIAGVAAESVRETVCLANRAAALGYKAALVRAPRYYQPLSDPALYFQAVADNARIPLMVSDLQDSMGEICEHPNLEVIEGTSGAAALWSSLRAGASGAIVPLANAAPYAVISIWEAFRTREEEAGLDLQAKIADAAGLVETRYGIPGLKYAMDRNGYYGGPPRLPLRPLTPEAKKAIEKAFQNLTG